MSIQAIPKRPALNVVRISGVQYQQLQARKHASKIDPPDIQPLYQAPLPENRIESSEAAFKVLEMVCRQITTQTNSALNKVHRRILPEHSFSLTA